MNFRARLLASTTMLGVASFATIPAHAGLLGASATVQAFFYNGAFGSPAGLLANGDLTSDPTSLAAAVHYDNNLSQVNILVDDTQITLTNQVGGAPFCMSNTPGTACVDAIDGFDFKFTGENITGVTVDPSSSAAFLPVSGTFQSNTHLGLQLLGNNEIQVDLTGDSPAADDKLVLDLTFDVTPPPPPPPPTDAPEPGTLALLGSALIGLNAVRRRRR